jgi:hypothetical protein
MLCCTCAICFSAAASSENDHEDAVEGSWHPGIQATKSVIFIGENGGAGSVVRLRKHLPAIIIQRAGPETSGVLPGSNSMHVLAHFKRDRGANRVLFEWRITDEA